MAADLCDLQNQGEEDEEAGEDSCVDQDEENPDPKCEAVEDVSWQHGGWPNEDETDSKEDADNVGHELSIVKGLADAVERRAVGTRQGGLSEVSCIPHCPG